MQLCVLHLRKVPCWHHSQEQDVLIEEPICSVHSLQRLQQGSRALRGSPRDSEQLAIKLHQLLVYVLEILGIDSCLRRLLSLLHQWHVRYKFKMVNVGELLHQLVAWCLVRIRTFKLIANVMHTCASILLLHLPSSFVGMKCKILHNTSLQAKLPELQHAVHLQLESV